MSKDTRKVGLGDLSEALLKRVLSYLGAKKVVYPAMCVCKRIYQLGTKDGPFLTRCFFSDIKVPYSYGGYELGALEHSERLELLKEVYGSGTVPISLFSYFTDGGVDKGEAKYFIQNVYLANAKELYSAFKGENIHVASVCSESVASAFVLDELDQYALKSEGAEEKKGNSTYRLPVERLLAAHDPQNSKHIAFIKYYDINRNIQHYTCLLQSFALFVSMEQIASEHPLVQLFQGITTFEQMQQLGFEFTHLQEDGPTKVVEFALSSPRQVEATLQKHKGPRARLNGVYPLIWGEIVKTTVNYLNVTQRIGFRYLLLKLINSQKTSGDSNIDCHNIQVSGSTLILKHSYEE